MRQVTEGQPPRKMQAVIPKRAPPGESKDGQSRATVKAGNGSLAASHGNRLLEHLHNGTWKNHKLVAVQTRSPKYESGQYRLNFSGRVLAPSVKNMQLETDGGECLLQFGRVDERVFHLDFKVRRETWL